MDARGRLLSTREQTLASRARLRQFMFKSRLTTDVEFLVRRYINMIPVRLSSQGEFTPVPFSVCEFFSKILAKYKIKYNTGTSHTIVSSTAWFLYWIEKFIPVRTSQQNVGIRKDPLQRRDLSTRDFHTKINTCI